MGSRPMTTPFRVFGSPYTLSLHQHVTYLRLKQLPFRVYCTSFTTTLAYSLYYRARSVFCTLTPSGASPLQVWQLAEAVELDEEVEAIARFAKGEVRYTGKSIGGLSTTAPRTQRLLVQKETHPQLHLASWCVVVYACWWLAKTGAMFRYIRGDALDVLEGYVRYFFPIPGFGFARAMAPRFREVMTRLVSATGASEVTAPYMEEHFERFCMALEEHLRRHPNENFLLCTPHPTLADVTLGAAFSSLFLMDDPPSSMLAEKFPCVTEYVERVTGWRGATFVDVAGNTVCTSEGASLGKTEPDEVPIVGRVVASATLGSIDYPDTVPDSLAPCFELIAEVFPFLMSQCASFKAFMSSNGVRTLRREPLEGEWKGCSGYLMPQLANIRSLMIVDDNVSSVQARSQDLEIAFLAAREVLDDTLHDFGRREGCSLDDGPHDSKTRDTEVPTAHVSAAIASKNTHHTEESTHVGAGSAERFVAPVQDATLVENSAARTEGADFTGRVGAATAEAAQFERPLDLKTMRAEEADFYRAYTAAARYKVAGAAASLSDCVPSAHQAIGASSTAVAVGESVNKHLQTLYAMLAKMGCPQYTLTSLYHGRRIYVAAIPEYEVAKVRKARREAVSKGTTTPLDVSSAL